MLKPDRRKTQAHCETLSDLKSYIRRLKTGAGRIAQSKPTASSTSGAREPGSDPASLKYPGA